MTGSDASQSFYTHDTCLEDKANPHVSIRSETLPLEMRSPIRSDSPALLDLFSDERNTKHDQSAVGLNTPSAVDNFITQWLTFTDPLDRIGLVVVAQGKVVGLSGMGHISTETDGRRIGDAGIMIDSEARGMGYAYESLRMTFDYGLRVLNLDEVTVAMTGANVAMRGLMDKKFGLSPTKLTRANSRFGNDYMYSVTKGDLLPCLQSSGDNQERGSSLKVGSLSQWQSRPP